MRGNAAVEPSGLRCGRTEDGLGQPPVVMQPHGRRPPGHNRAGRLAHTVAFGRRAHRVRGIEVGPENGQGDHVIVPGAAMTTRLKKCGREVDVAAGCVDIHGAFRETPAESRPSM